MRSGAFVVGGHGRGCRGGHDGSHGAGARYGHDGEHSKGAAVAIMPGTAEKQGAVMAATVREPTMAMIASIAKVPRWP
ncbi:hypothetical protein SD70_04790 [Gordoniibacillus kamchatkensis]|uniref:Uncharacterized protein n=1 Tax=Gordoniibacillus kamchatkensis TaxID=1590651 RepID=A0ABR5AL00_9BACL|nr:hypothetical protein SD70_04790 [Paenibacillus sp. VKM B-2647]